MTATPLTPADRASFNGALAAILADHATMRHLADAASQASSLSADAAMSLADAMATHEAAEANLFALPFITRPPKDVTVTAARARQRCQEYTAGNSRPRDPSAAVAPFVDALLAHLAAEEAWLADEKEHQAERLRIVA